MRKQISKTLKLIRKLALTLIRKTDLRKQTFQTLGLLR